MKIQKVLRFSAAMLTMMVGQTVCAYDFEDGGIYYNITSETTAEVTRNNFVLYSGDVEIPSVADNAGKTYSVTMIGSHAFYGCHNLASVSIPGSVTSIGVGAFYDCHNLASVSIPGSVTSVGECAFYDCYNLASVSIPSSVTFIGESAFENCKSLSYISVESGNKHYTDKEGVLFNRDMTELMAFPISHAKTEYVIPSTVTSVGNRSFWSCSGLTSVTIPSSVTSIGENAFNGCHGLTSVTVPASVTSIGVSAFVNCQNLSSISVESGNSHYADKEGVLFNHGISELLVFPAGYANTGYVIPSSVTAIAYSAFGNCHGLTSVSIPSSVTSIGDYAFGNCHGLTSVSIPSSVASIGVGVFGNCRALASVDLPSSVISIGDSAFSGCEGLTSVDLPSSVTSIGAGAFYGCRAMASVTLPSALASIGNGAFNSCWSLTSVDLPSSVTSIGDGAFYGCEGLTAVYCRWAKALECSEYMFSNDVYERCTLYVPRGITELRSYGTTKPWSNFKHIKGTNYSGIEGVYGETEGVVVSVNGGDVCVAGAADGACVEVYSSGGECVYRGTETRICGLGRGVYVVRVCGKSFKAVLNN